MIRQKPQTIQDVERLVQESIASLKPEKLPPGSENLAFLAPKTGFTAKVEFRNVEKNRDVRSDKAYEKHPWSGRRIIIDYVPADRSEVGASRSPEMDASPAQRPAEEQLVKALASVESQKEFVELSWFRDQHLPTLGLRWTELDGARDAALQSAIDRQWLATYHVPNPQSWARPTAAVRLNRSHPEVARILGQGALKSSVFRPVRIRGEALSETVQKERR